MEKKSNNDVLNEEVTVAGDKRCQEHVTKIVRRGCLMMALCVTVALFTLPIVFYFTTAYTNINSESSQLNMNAVNDTAEVGCHSTIISWGTQETDQQQNMTTTTCSTPYLGSICLPFLSEWHKCILPEQELNIAVPTDSQAALDQELLSLRGLLESSFPKCWNIAIPFLCRYYFPLKKCTTGDLYTSTQEDCLIISEGVCATPWSIAKEFGYGDKLPDCSTLPPKYDSRNASQNGLDFQSISGSQNISCRDDFFLVGNTTCYPRCDRFEEHSHTSIRVVVVAEIIGAAIAAAVSVIGLSLSIYNRKNMFKFPSVLLLFLLMDVLIAALLVFIVAVDRNGLLCSSMNLIEAINNSTVFCNISGALFHYVILNMAMWWIFHLCVFFYEIMFPFHSQQMKGLGRFKYVGIILISSGLFIPLPGVIIGLTSETHQYRIIRFPPTVCTTDEELWFYATTLPFSMAIGTGVCLLIMIFWVVSKHQSSSAKLSSKKRTLSTAEKKIIMVAICFIMFGVYTAIHLGVVTGNSDKAIDGYYEYFICESSGHIPGKCDRSAFERHLFPYMSAISYILMGTIPIAILNFIVNYSWQKLWKSVKKQFGSKVNNAKSSNQAPSAGLPVTKRFSLDNHLAA